MMPFGYFWFIFTEYVYWVIMSMMIRNIMKNDATTCTAKTICKFPLFFI